MAYTKTIWSNNSTPPINDINLNKIETGIEEAHNNVDTHINDATNPHSVTNEQIGAEAIGVAQTLVTTHETTYNHDNFVEQTDLDSHTTNMSNPHSVTALQVGAEPVGTTSTAITTHETTYNHDNFVEQFDIDTSITTHTTTYNHDNFVTQTNIDTTVTTHETTYDHLSFVDQTDIETRVTTHETTYNHSTFVNQTDIDSSINTHTTTYDHTAFVEQTDIDTSITTHETTYDHNTFVTQSDIDTSIATKEDSLGNPTNDGEVLTSLADGTRSWIDRTDNLNLKKYSETILKENITTTYQLNPDNGSVIEVTLTGNTTFTLATPTLASTTKSVGFTLILKQDATGSRVTTWPTTIKWPSKTLPSLSTSASSIDVLTFITTDGGSTWFGFISGLDMGVIS